LASATTSTTEARTCAPAAVGPRIGWGGSDLERVGLGSGNIRAAELAGRLPDRNHRLTRRTADLRSRGARIAPPVDLSSPRVDLPDPLGEILDGDARTFGQQLPHRFHHEHEPADALVHVRVQHPAAAENALDVRLGAELAPLEVLDLHLLDDVPEVHW